MIAVMRDVLLVGLGAGLTLGLTFAVTLWLVRDTVIPRDETGD